MNTLESLIIEVTTQALLYGLYVATLVHCLRWLLYDDKGWSHRNDVKWPMLITTLVIFLFYTGSLLLDLRSVFAGTAPLTTAGVSTRNLQGPEE